MDPCVGRVHARTIDTHYVTEWTSNVCRHSLTGCTPGDRVSFGALLHYKRLFDKAVASPHCTLNRGTTPLPTTTMICAHRSRVSFASQTSSKTRAPGGYRCISRNSIDLLSQHWQKGPSFVSSLPRAGGVKKVLCHAAAQRSSGDKMMHHYTLAGAFDTLADITVVFVFDDGREMAVEGMVLAGLASASPMLTGALKGIVCDAQSEKAAAPRLAMPGTSFEGCQHVLEALDVRGTEPQILSSLVRACERTSCVGPICACSISSSMCMPDTSSAAPAALRA